MPEAAELSVEGIRWLMAAIAIASVLLGRLSIVKPQRSIELYQRIMRRFNWHVRPIDEAKEVRNTRRLGVTLIVLSLVLVWLLIS